MPRAQVTLDRLPKAYAHEELRAAQHMQGHLFSWGKFVEEHLQPCSEQINIVEVGSGTGSFAAGFAAKYLEGRDDENYVNLVKITKDLKRRNQHKL